MLLKRFAKNQKSSEHRFFIKFEKPYFGPILALFGPETSKQDFSQKII